MFCDATKNSKVVAVTEATLAHVTWLNSIHKNLRRFCQFDKPFPLNLVSVESLVFGFSFLEERTQNWREVGVGPRFSLLDDFLYVEAHTVRILNVCLDHRAIVNLFELFLEASSAYIEFVAASVILVGTELCL